MSLEDYDDYDYNSPIKALQSLENAVENKNVNEILDLTEAYKNELYSAGKIAEDMQSSINNKLDLIDKFSMTIGLVGSLGSQISNPDIKPIFDISSSLGLMVPLVFKSKIGKLILNKTTRFNKPDHVLFLYDNYEKLDIHSFNRNHILNRTNYKINYIPFNDELTDKYKYYECLYENIPLIRVYIDIIAEKQVIKGYTIEHIDTKIKQYFKDLFDRELHIPKIELLTKQILLYGVAYLSKGWEYTSKGKNFKINLINPKFIRPNIKDNKIVGYKMLTKDHEEKLFLKSEIDCFKEISIIELYSFLLDANYPQITKKGDRPLLIYDKMENYEKQLEKNKDDPDKFVKILEDSLKLFKTLCDSSYPRNIYYEVGFLRVLGTIEMHKRNPRKALYYFEKAQDLIPEYPSEELKQIDYELTYIIINLQKFL